MAVGHARRRTTAQKGKGLFVRPHQEMQIVLRGKEGGREGGDPLFSAHSCCSLHRNHALLRSLLSEHSFGGGGGSGCYGPMVLSISSPILGAMFFKFLYNCSSRPSVPLSVRASEWRDRFSIEWQMNSLLSGGRARESGGGHRRTRILWRTINGTGCHNKY